MFTKNITISVAFIALFTVLAIALPVTFAENAQLEKATVEAWGGGGSDGGGEGGDYGGGGCGGCGGSTPDPTPEPEPEPNPPVCNYLKANGQTGTLTLPYGHSGDVNLSWASTRATGATLTPTGSSVAVNGSKFVNVTADTSYVLRVTNSDGADSCRVNIDVQEQVLPTCNYLKANGQTGTVNLPYGVNTVNLTWSTTNADSVVLNPGNISVAKNNNTGRVMNVTQDTTFVILATNAAGTSPANACKVIVDVSEERALTCQDVAFDSDPSSPVFPGTSVNLSWVFTGDVSAATIDNGIGDAFAKNNADFVINNTTTFNATISNATSQKVCPYTITVKEYNAPSCDTFTADPETLPYGGGQSLLKWTTTNADSVSIDNGIGSVLANNTTGHPVDVTENITYTMTVSAAGYDDVTCPASITVGEPEVLSCENNVTFTSNDYSLPKGGGNVTLTWTTTGIDSINIAGVASNDLNGSEVVHVSSDATYTLAATADGVTINCPLSIDVATGGGGGGSSSPKCDLDISDEKIKKGESVTLEWNTSRAKEVRIEDNHGNVLIDSDNSDDFDGKMTIKPTEDTEYTLFSKKGTSQRKCTVEVEVEVENSVTVIESRSHDPRVAGISLTQVPYTGFEAGPVLTMIFYTLLTLWGLFVAYVVVIRRKSAGGVSFAGAHDHVDFTDQSVEASNTQESSIAEGYVYEATATAPTNLPTAQPLEKVVGYDSYVEKKTMNH